ncbi:L-aspartate oxidase [Tepidibacter formicigenes]|jgi:L-aspartate oxidase|uniref:L-aspartate oxidase n=1 Tax=Tepidibacter formicigenes DSM 15518 TaxID=1123349 RepID=A0A1M6QB66_9FIRM|nr:L-aspartate oxidase [Tepidibacter formicigenes]SHK17431.1 L-aspartate oxidase [Tepidibacter formicigenes DSM 15518]
MFYDVVVVGSGIAGLYTCINLDEKFKVLLLSKDKLDLNNTSLAQGGIASVLDENDRFKYHFEDTLIAGNYKNNKKHLEIMVKEGPKDIEKLLNIGVDFDKDNEGNLLKTLEGAHSKRRIVHHKDKTGREIIDKLIKNIKNKKNIEILENAFLANIKKDELFKLTILKDNKNYIYRCNYLVLATGGIGKIYKYTTNSSISTGDGIAMAHILGANIKGLNLIQFHPTALNIGNNERFLISEAVRGEGAFLLNNKFERFMSKYDKREELSPRDVVSKSIIKEINETKSENIYLDISYKDDGFIKNRFPNIYENCLKYGIDITKEKIPVYPSHHYLMGGIDVDKNSQSSIDKLYAVGECSHTGVHGNNRLASNSLLEGLVFSRRAAEDINKKDKIELKINCETKYRNIDGNIELDNNYKKDIQNIMQSSYFVNLNKNKAKEGIKKINYIIKELKNNNYIKNVNYYETRNMAIISKLILEESLKNDK